MKNKDYFIEKLYRRRLKMYMHTLMLLHPEYAEFDVSDVRVEIRRTWEENLLELAQTIGSLAATNLFSEKYLIELMPNGDYEVELSQRQEEETSGTKRQMSNASVGNSYFGDYTALLRQDESGTANGNDGGGNDGTL